MERYNPVVLRQCRERKGWMWFTQSLVDAKEYLVREFYANVAHIKQGTKRKGQPSTTTSQSDEPSVVVVEAVYIPSTSVEPSSSTTTMPLPPSSVPTAVPSTCSTSALKPILASLNNWMQTATAKLSDLPSTIAAQSSIQAPQVPPTVEEILKKLLLNQNTIMATLPRSYSTISTDSTTGQSEDPDSVADTTEAVRQMNSGSWTPEMKPDSKKSSPGTRQQGAQKHTMCGPQKEFCSRRRNCGPQNSTCGRKQRRKTQCAIGRDQSSNGARSSTNVSDGGSDIAEKIKKTPALLDLYGSKNSIVKEYDDISSDGSSPLTLQTVNH
nr:uncharacterized serine-rich protein C215.13-like [Nicotiana tomentosiformis]